MAVTNLIRRFFELIGNNTLLLFGALKYLPSLPRQAGRVVEQSFIMGYQTMPIVAILSFFIGAVLALQTGFALQPVGAEAFIGSIVGLSVARELGPVMTAILLAGRVGSAITAELASMKVYQEVDALRTMNIPPEKILVLPRLAAAFLMVPVLAILSILIGFYGGMGASVLTGFIQLDPSLYWRSLTDFVGFRDIVDGLIKAQIFGFVVVLISCNQGLQTSGGPREIGFSVTKAVVTSLIFILFADYFITLALF
jgi:phospholipid/cholesterol/gamma-HCH transport system permease protein